ncbi:unnamed protein product [Meloidogyne enterolobii]|uniref:Uncharacterized protein n=1 Tax=Meloidogyne enterolobii TaxID=390850 RepID=A0ACB1ABG5_MELEN
MTLRDVQKIHQIASWLLEHSDSDGQRQFLQSYSQFRAENMMKPLQFIADQIGPNNRVKSGQFVKTALKKAASRIGINLKVKIISVNFLADSNDQLHRDNAIAVTLFMLSSTVVLIQLETEQSSAVFGNVSVEAEVLRQIVGACLGRVLSHALRVVDSYEGSFMILLPLARFMLKHANQLASLSERIRLAVVFCLRMATFGILNSIIYNNLFKIKVHPISSGTLNLLKVLVQQQKLLNQLIQRAEVHESPGALAVQILKALSQNLRQKSSTYEDPALASLFMINNLQYIGQTVSRERTLLALLQGDQTAFPSSFETEAESYLQQFLKVWSKVGEVFNADLGPGEEKRSVKSIFTVFTREFDAIVEQQKIYCVADQITANNVRMRIKSLILQPFVEFSKKNSQECSELFEADRQLKYDAETIEMIIDRLFDATL